MIEKKIAASPDFHFKLPSYKSIVIATVIASLLFMPEIVLEMSAYLAGIVFDGFAFVLYQLFHEMLGLSRTQSDIIVGSTIMATGVISLIFLSFQSKRIYSWIADKTKLFCKEQKKQFFKLWKRTSWPNKILFFVVYLPFGLFCMSFLII